MNDGKPRNEGHSQRRDATASRYRPTVTARPHGALAGRNSVDVICAGMYRACSTWQYEVVAHLLEHHRGGRRLGYLTAQQYAGLTGSVSPGTGQGPHRFNGWRVLKSHEGDRCFARAIAGRRALVVYAYRDVRDVIFSLMHKRGLTFEQLLGQGMIHQVLANDAFWCNQPDVLIQRYDDILADPVAAIRALANYLGVEPAEGEAESIAAAYSLESNKARTEALRRKLEQDGVDLSEAANAQICDAATLLHWNHVRSGGSGSWFTESTPRQRIILHRLCGRWLNDHRYPRVPAGAVAEEIAAPGGPGEWIGIERDILAGWLSYLVRAASQRFPRLASTARRAMGIKTPSQVGAVVWSESKPAATERDGSV